MIVTAVAAFALATAAQAQERKPYASLREAIQEQGALREEHELMIKRAVCEWLRKDEEKNSTVTIFGNDITIRANYGLRWSWKNMDAFAKGIACWALMIDAAEAERAHKDEYYRYFHVIIEDSGGIAGEAIVDRVNYPSWHELAADGQAAETQARVTKNGNRQ